MRSTEKGKELMNAEQDLRVTLTGRCSLTRLRRQYVAIYTYTCLRSTDMRCWYRRHRSRTLLRERKLEIQWHQKLTILNLIPQCTYLTFC